MEVYIKKLVKEINDIKVGEHVISVNIYNGVTFLEKNVQMTPGLFLECFDQYEKLSSGEEYWQLEKTVDGIKFFTLQKKKNGEK